MAGRYQANRELVKLAKTLDQAQAILTFVEAIVGEDPVVYSDVALPVDAGNLRHLENLNTLFDFIFKGLDALAYEEHLDYDIAQSTNPDFNKAIVRVNVFRQHRRTIQAWTRSYGNVKNVMEQEEMRWLIRLPPLASLPNSPLRSTSSSWKDITPIEEDHGKGKADSELKDPKDSLADTKLVGELVKPAILTYRSHRGEDPVVYTIAAALAYGHSNTFVTSPSPENLNTLFDFIFKGLDALAYEEHLDYDIAQSTNPDFNKAIVRGNVFRQHRQTIQAWTRSYGNVKNGMEQEECAGSLALPHFQACQIAPCAPQVPRVSPDQPPPHRRSPRSDRTSS
ncbi:hypothetical protein BU15DRAFT_75622 [Melanogaster broomeanus]|nr:hypothetical protein BU15DRAFT_75622 [Melanogaster broomeanus]